MQMRRILVISGKDMILMMVFSMCLLRAYTQENGMISLYTSYGVATKDFKHAVDNSMGGSGMGFALNGMWNPNGSKKYSPVFLGVDLGYTYFGKDKYASGSTWWLDPSTSPGYKTSFECSDIYAVARTFLTKKPEGFTPFVDSFLGASLYSSTTKIDKTLIGSILSDDQPIIIKEFAGTSFGYGTGIGFYNRKLLEGKTKASLTVRILYYGGTQIKYMVRRSIIVENGYVDYDTGTTRISMLKIQIGINFSPLPGLRNFGN